MWNEKRIPMLSSSPTRSWRWPHLSPSVTGFLPKSMNQVEECRQIPTSLLELGINHERFGFFIVLTRGDPTRVLQVVEQNIWPFQQVVESCSLHTRCMMSSTLYFGGNPRNCVQVSYALNTYSTFADAIHGCNMLVLWLCLARSRHAYRTFAHVQHQPYLSCIRCRRTCEYVHVEP